MESEDDVHDANEVASVEEDEGDDDDCSYDYTDEKEDDNGDYDFIAKFSDELDDIVRSQKSYTILKEEDIHQRQEEDITKISTVLSIPREDACILLHHYKWSVNKVHDEWFANEEAVRKGVGLLEKPSVKCLDFTEVTCGICLENYSCNSLRSVACAHLFCNSCWKAYITTAINDGPGCLTLRCPDPSCGAAVGQDMIEKWGLEEIKEKYQRYLLRSYVEESRKIKWCPAPGCDSAVEYVGCSGNYDVTCGCMYSFCWNCTEEAHRPVDCETVRKWILKNSAESGNLDWILANAKPCPKCKRPIQKNHGCMHMTCSPPCKFEFCWLCLGTWSDHSERTGGFYACNRYEANKQDGETERRWREMAKNSLERYTHYYERWASNQSSRKKAVSDLHQMQCMQLEKLSEVQSQPESRLEFIIEAWQQIVECRRVLKWTYAYGYYLPEREDTKKRFFEYLQGEAESGLERLHQYAEKELMSYVDMDGPSKHFNDFRAKLVDLTRVTRNYFENLVKALEKGLSDVSACSSKNVAGISKGKGVRRKGSSKKGTSLRNGDDTSNWTCDQCSYMNISTAVACHNCQHRR